MVHTYVVEFAKRIVSRAPTPLHFDMNNALHVQWVNHVVRVVRQLKQKQRAVKFDHEDTLHIRSIYLSSLIYANCYGVPMSYKHTLVRLVAAKLKSNLSTSAAIVASSIAANLVGILQGNYQSMFNLNFDGKVNEYKFEKPKKPSALNTKKNLFAIQRAAFTVDRNTTVQAVLDWIQSTFCVSPTYTRAYGYNVIESDANKALLEVLSEHAFHHTETLTNIFVCTLCLKHLYLLGIFL
jgi:hypothetical protein